MTEGQGAPNLDRRTVLSGALALGAFAVLEPLVASAQGRLSEIPQEVEQQVPSPEHIDEIYREQIRETLASRKGKKIEEMSNFDNEKLMFALLGGQARTAGFDAFEGEKGITAMMDKLRQNHAGNTANTEALFRIWSAALAMKEVAATANNNLVFNLFYYYGLIAQGKTPEVTLEEARLNRKDLLRLRLANNTLIKLKETLEKFPLGR